MIDFDSLMTWVHLPNLLTLEKEPWQLGALNSTAWHSTISRDDEQFSSDHVTFNNATCDAFIMSGSQIGLCWRPFRFNRWTSSPAAIHNLQDSHLQWLTGMSSDPEEASKVPCWPFCPENLPEHPECVIEVHVKWFLHLITICSLKRGYFWEFIKRHWNVKFNWLGTGQKWVKNKIGDQ